MHLSARRPVNEIIVHCAATPEGRDISAATIREWHTSSPLNWRDIGYHFVIRLDGTIEVGRPLNRVGAHVRGRNTGTIGVCYVGGVTNDGTQTPKDTRTSAQRASLRNLLTNLVQANPEVSRISGHRDYAAKACPSFDATTEYAGLLDARLATAAFTDQGMVEEAGTPTHRSTTNVAAGVSGTAASVSTISYAAREAAESGRTAMEALGDMWPIAVAAIVIVGAAIWIIKERRRHARENGV